MQNKGFVRLFAILLALVSIYQLSFTFIAANVEKKAKEYAQGDALKELHYLDSMSNVTVFNIGIVDYNYKECKELEINLGLDLKGGMNVILEVSVPDIVRALSNYSQDPTFNKAIAMAKEKLTNSQKDFITLFGESFEEIDPGARLAAIFNTMELKDKISYNSTNQQVIDVIRAEARDAIDNSFNVLRTRIDKFGVAQPNIQRLGLESSGRILIELPGVKDRERVRKLLQGTANLEFWETFDNSQVYQYLLEANNIIKEINEDKAARQEKETAANTDSEANADTTEAKDQTSDEFSDLIQEGASKDSTEIQTEESIRKNYPLFSVLQPNTNQQGQLRNGPVVGIARTADTAQVDTYLNLPRVKEILPRNLKLLWTANPMDEGGQYYQLIAIKVTNRDGRPVLDGDAISDARADFGQNKASAEVDLTMTTDGAKVWARITKENVGKSIAIVLDNYVRSFPNVIEEIKGGRTQITGMESFEEAKDLANVLKSGRMPAPAHIINENVVGPSLGHEAITDGLMSFIVAFIIVLLYMIFYYGVKAGLIADLALIANLFFIMGVLASFGAVLTLPGIAGIVLTIGTSVDANVLIYERIREEIKGGKAIKKAVAAGYKNAISAIIDANVTTFLTGVVLYTFGTGPIKGFATTLMIGIVTSFFTAVFMSRLIFEQLLKKETPLKFDTKITRNLFANAHIQFISKRKIAYFVSGALILVSIISLVTRGLDQGIDFTGGRTYVIEFAKPVNTVEIQDAIKGQFEGELMDVKTYGEANQVKIGTNYQIYNDDPELDNIIEDKFYKALKPFLAEGTTFEKFVEDDIRSSQKVGPTIADDIKKDAVWAILFSLVIIFLYILIRFKNWQFSFGAVAALAHDSMITLGLFSLLYGYLPFSLSIDQAFIAAILTVIGYSINDTVVVFDRIRERITEFPKRKREDVINEALNSTLSRTLSTSLSTFVVLLTIFIFGGEVIRGFVFALMVGVVVGTYSSLYVATPIAYDTQNATKKKKK
ncbi:protein translocase subunit SecDF [Saccharicrinis sp. FJH2]|uniref:protein translocase subunit SecDF n=1 Tax=Saccharicrinis sp. FJH65 TaxID=3344659 RepID=UPI0035F2B4AA